MAGGTGATLLWVLFAALSAFAWTEQTSNFSQHSVHIQYCLLPETAGQGSTSSVRVYPFQAVYFLTELCDTFPYQNYRTADGTCNHIFNYGASSTPVRRLLPPAYEDKKGAPRTRGKSGKPLPAATTVSRFIHPKPSSPAEGTTFMVMQWGQFMDHDITGFPLATEEDNTLRCCGRDGETPCFSPESKCFPILLDAGDKRFGGRRCMEFARSLAAEDKHKKKLSPREQMNSVTSFIDASTVYGSTQEVQNKLRDSSGGKLQARLRMFEDLDLLPKNGLEDCIITKGSKEFCFLAGDERVNEHPGLMTIHTIFARVHNIIVKGLQSTQRHRTQEEIFQTARKILGAIIQNIQYNEWLPMILNSDTRKTFQLITGQRTHYIPLLDPRMMNAFSTAAFRFGHSLIPDAMFIGGEAIPIRALFGKPRQLFRNFNGVVEALITNKGKSDKRDRFFTPEVTRHLFEMDEPGTGLDLVALNIQRGRDHGLPPYNHYRRVCGLKVFKAFKDLQVSPRAQYLYKTLYKSVDDIDLFTGLMTEKNLPGAMVGPTLSCLIGLQFHALKFGDRFYFEHNRKEGFTDDQLKNIREITLASIFCQMKGIERVQANPFLDQGKKNPFIKCKKAKFVDYHLYK
ncbi:hypothetical protein ACOMHN_038919 [Nucella lapillus]